MYYIWSLLVTLLVFAAIQYNEFKNDKEKYKLWSFGNISTLVIIYLLSTIMFYMLFGIDYNCINKINGKSSKGGSERGDMKGNGLHNIDPVMLRRIPDQMYTGFDPYADRCEL